MKPILVLYHANCPDGFGAAWAAWKKFGKRAEYLAVEPRELPVPLPKDREIYVLDNSYSAAILKKLMRTNKRVVVIDHHESSRKDVAQIPGNIFDSKHSGAVLAWRHFHRKKSMPRLLEYVEDCDLWRYQLPDSEALCTFIALALFEFPIWSQLAVAFERSEDLAKFTAQGKLLLAYEDRLIDEIARKAGVVEFKGHRVLAVNSSAKRLTSELGHRLCRKQPPFGIVWYIEKGKLKVSMRAAGRLDVSKLASAFPEGGGHPNAAGFTIPFKGRFPWRVLKK